MATNNALLYNAALAGFQAGAVAGQVLTSITPSDYALIVAQSKQFAIEMDSLIATDTAGSPQPAGSVGISVAGGLPIYVPGTAAVAASQAAKPALMYGLCYSFAFQRYGTGALAASFAEECAAIRVLYLAAAAEIVTT